MPALPPAGRPAAELMDELRSLRGADVDYRGGRTWSLVYWAGDDHHDVVRAAHDLFLAENALNPMAFPSLKRLESEVVGMTAGLLHAPPEAVGTMTSGGTESLLLAVLAARDRAAARRPWVRRPNVVAPLTVHPAVDKACHLFGVRLRKAAVLPDGRADVAAMGRLVDRSTVLLIGSAPSYPWGVVDPIPELGTLGLRRGVPVHVDACFGGFVLPWLERLGVALPTWDFRVPGVTSMSADVHKYGYAPKGASVILYRDTAHFEHQLFVETGWPGGVYASPTLAGTRPGGPIAAAWASLQELGEAGFLDRARQAWAAAEALRAGVVAIPGLRLLGRPDATIVTWASDDPAVDVYAVADQLQARGWSVDRQQDPPSVHCTVNASNAATVGPYLADLRAAVDVVRADPTLATTGQAALYGLLSAVPLRRLTRRAVRRVLVDLYAPGGGDAGPPPRDERLERAARVVRRVRAAVPASWVRLAGRQP